ncbi:hypothetical protein [Devosia sp.]|uniref:hypothetical protein n=1 Tax=Devosia sp. TaxID=1871048 RepID=UPI00326344DD
MADYKELLRRAITALPENNGAARRAVYEKARSALVGQLRAINPPLPARDITQHRLQLEDCIRQVEQEASEAVITLGREHVAPPRVEPEPVVAATPEPAPPAPRPEPTIEARRPESTIEARKPYVPPQAVVVPAPSVVERPAASESIEDIISAAEQANPKADVSPPQAPKPAEPVVAKTALPVIEARPEPRMVPSIVARAEAAKSAASSPMPNANRTYDRPGFEPRREPMPSFAANAAAETIRSNGLRLEPSIGMGGQSAARQQLIEAIQGTELRPVETALSSVREVDLEPASQPNPAEAEGAIERAIETLDREARGEKTAMLPETPDRVRAVAANAADTALLDDDHAEPQSQRRGAGLTIFLVVFALLLAGVGGAGFWAWREGYVNLDQMFGRSTTAVAETAPATGTATTPTLDTTPQAAPVQPVAGPGNTAGSTGSAAATTALDGLEPEERLEPTPTAVVPSVDAVKLPDVGTATTPSNEERLPVEDPTQAAVTDPAASVDPAVLAGSQSLLLEASSDGRTGAVPFSGTVEWSEGVDEIGLPTLVAKANIPARNLSVDLIIRKNADPSLPASHLMEVNFQVSDSFIGGTIAGLPGVLLKNEELVQGTPLVGASARVVGSSFLFALSAADKDMPANIDLLTSRKWMDFAVIYGTGTRAIITLEKDDAAQALFTKVFTAWSAAAKTP